MIDIIIGICAIYILLAVAYIDISSNIKHLETVIKEELDKQSRYNK